MALITKETIGEVDPVFMRPTERCFYCGSHLGGEYWVMWQGADETGVQIWLHPPCAKFLADTLGNDFRRRKAAA